MTLWNYPLKSLTCLEFKSPFHQQSSEIKMFSQCAVLKSCLGFWFFFLCELKSDCKQLDQTGVTQQTISKSGMRTSVVFCGFGTLISLCSPACMYLPCWHWTETLLSWPLAFCDVWETCSSGKKKKMYSWAWKKAVVELDHSSMSNPVSPLSLIVPKAHPLIEIRLHFWAGGAGGCHQPLCVKRAIASIWLKSCWKCWRLQHSVAGGLSASVLLVLLPSTMFLALITWSLPNVRERMNPDIHSRAVPLFGSQSMFSG